MSIRAYQSQISHQRVIGQSRCGKVLPGGAKSAFFVLGLNEKAETSTPKPGT